MFLLMQKQLISFQLHLWEFLSLLLSPRVLGLLWHQTHTKASETSLGRSWGTFPTPS